MDDSYLRSITLAAETVSAEWGVSDFSQYETRDGIGYYGNLTRAGSTVGEFSDKGDGGATMIHFATSADQADFDAEAARFFPDNAEASATLILALLERQGL